MKITRYQDQEKHQNPHGVDVRKLYDKESAQVSHITLQPGESLKPHKTPVDVFFVVLEGSPVIQVGDEEEICEKDSLIESPAHIVHNIYNASPDIARILVVKAPRPATISRVL
ncbi:MAG: cupin domain-containing protein [Bacteroidota bacterium]|nr:cupin domain-containing protein [Odoribacter sp.]MDP3643292.1 cupin domain-containing protein [Bacteroidota bacterium]